MIVVLAVTLIVVVVPKRTIPTLQVTGVSLNPNTAIDPASATLNLTVRNNDPTNEHSVLIGFNVANSTLLTVYEGNQSLPTVFGLNDDVGISKYQCLWVDVQPSEVATFSFRVTAPVGLGESTSTYLIHVEFEDENLTSFANKTVTLTVSTATIILG
jgi:uncharacterized 2Fe-2S/4Fe-4S cluster protein (DUF4445 family)